MSSTSGQFWTQQFLKPTGAPYVGVRVFHYVAGNTTTNLDVYQDAAMLSAHNNPVDGDVTGRVSFYGSGTYRLLIKSSTVDGNLTLYDWDPVELVHHTATVRAEDKGLSLPAATTEARGRLFGVTDLGGDVQSLWLEKSAAEWQRILTLPSLASMIQFAKGTDVASTTSVTLPTDGNFFDVTGTSPIETMTAYQAGTVIWTRYTGAGLTLIHGASSQVLPGGLNYTTIAGEIIQWMSVGAGVWVMQDSTRWGVSGTPIAGYGLIAGSILGYAQKNIMPVGSEMFWPLVAPPAHWVVGNGQAISRTTYSEYFAVVGTLYGVGNGTTTFNVPNYVGRVPVGLDPTNSVITTASTNGANAATIGGLFGSDRHQLAIAELASHVHVERHDNFNNGTGGNFLGIAATQGGTDTISATSTSLTGGDTPHSNTQPSIARQVIIYVGV